MRKTTIGQIERAMSGKLLYGNADDTVTGVTIDSRKIGQNEIFFALIGENYDAHDFIPNAIENGVKTIVVSREDMGHPGDGINVIKVDDTTKGLQDLAKWYVADLGIKKIGITGSTGKTTTKDILYHIFSEKYKTGKTSGNFNNHIGVPLTILSFDESIEVGILEMGAETVGEIHVLVDIARPNISIITNIGVSHIETFGGRDNIFKGKMQIADFLREEDLLVVNEESDYLSRENVSGKYRLATVGSTGKSDYILSGVTELADGGIEFVLEHMEKSKRFKLNIPGRHNAINASLAIAAAIDMGISMEEAAAGLQKIELTEKRLNITGKGGIKVIDDTYNASPDSVRAAIDVLLATKGIRKVAVLGDMMGLGDGSEQYHGQIGDYVRQKNIDLLITMGEFSKHIHEKAKEVMGENRVIHYTNRGKLESDIKNIVTSGDVVLVKGSRAMEMENIVRKILE